MNLPLRVTRVMVPIGSESETAKKPVCHKGPWNFTASKWINYPAEECYSTFQGLAQQMKRHRGSAAMACVTMQDAARKILGLQHG